MESSVDWKHYNKNAFRGKEYGVDNFKATRDRLNLSLYRKVKRSDILLHVDSLPVVTLGGVVSENKQWLLLVALT